MTDIHQDIREFWENKGFGIEGIVIGSNGYCYSWRVCNKINSVMLFCIAAMKKETSEVFYWGYGIFGPGERNKWYSEKEMLKIIRMKAFL